MAGYLVYLEMAGGLANMNLGHWKNLENMLAAKRPKSCRYRAKEMIACNHRR